MTRTKKDAIPCPHCNGTGLAPVSAPNSWRETSTDRAWEALRDRDHLRYDDGILLRVSPDTNPRLRLENMLRPGDTTMFERGGRRWIGRIEDVRHGGRDWDALLFVPFSGDAARDAALLECGATHPPRTET